jgi:hypothetical protein
MNRNDNIDILGNPWKSLSEEQKAQAVELAKSDSELSADLKFAKSLSTMSATELLGEPPHSDAVFLVSLRQKLNKPQTVQLFGSLSSLRLRISALVACVFLVAGIYWGGEQGGSLVSDNWIAELSADDPLVNSNLIWYQSYDDVEGVDAIAVADYLNMSEDADLWDFESDSVKSISDQLLELSPEAMEEVLNKLETISFFENQGAVNEG